MAWADTAITAPAADSAPSPSPFVQELDEENPSTETTFSPSTSVTSLELKVNDYGTAILSTESAKSGKIVTVKADEGYELGAISVTDANHKSVTDIDNGNGTYSYTQPYTKVTIDVSFKEIVPGSEVAPPVQVDPEELYVDQLKTIKTVADDLSFDLTTIGLPYYFWVYNQNLRATPHNPSFPTFEKISPSNSLKFSQSTKESTQI